MSVDALGDRWQQGRPGWLLDEVASAGRENLDAEHVARYDAKEDAGAAAEVALLQRAGLRADSVVVELGSGTGSSPWPPHRCARGWSPWTSPRSCWPGCAPRSTPPA